MRISEHQREGRCVPMIVVFTRYDKTYVRFAGRLDRPMSFDLRAQKLALLAEIDRNPSAYLLDDKAIVDTPVKASKEKSSLIIPNNLAFLSCMCSITPYLFIFRPIAQNDY